jgi:metal-sulfur cluster biosynthetic enzyme
MDARSLDSSVAAAGQGSASRTDEARAALRQVLDPELDQSVVELGFIADLVVVGDTVSVTFRLPTFWCSANFAWIMAEDMRLALAALPWLKAADIRLADHFASDKINEGIARNRSFRETFADEAGDDLAGLRATFRRKAYLGRMSALIEGLRELGWRDEVIVDATLGGLAAVDAGSPVRPLIDRYLELRAFFGGACRAGDAAFRTAEGEPIHAARLPAYLRDIRMTRRGVEANGEMCRILLAERYRDGGAAQGDRQAV